MDVLLCHCPRKGCPSTVKDYRPVALPSPVMKTFEWLVLDHLRLLVLNYLDPLQFVHQADIIHLLHRAYT